MRVSWTAIEIHTYQLVPEVFITVLQSLFTKNSVPIRNTYEKILLSKQFLWIVIIKISSIDLTKKLNEDV